MKTITRITINQNGNQILTCKVCKDINNILFMSNEGILELISGLNYMDNLPIVPDLEKPIEIQVSIIQDIPLEQNKRVQTKIKEIIYNNLYDTLVEELKDTISRFQAQYNKLLRTQQKLRNKKYHIIYPIPQVHPPKTKDK